MLCERAGRDVEILKEEKQELNIGRLVLIHYQDRPTIYARIEAIEPDVKKDWYHLTLLLLTIPAKTVTWILREEYILGAPFTMGGQAMRPLNFLANRAFAVIFSWLLNQRFTDTLCGTKALTKVHYERIAANRSYFGQLDPFGDFDLIFGAARLNLKIVDVPIRYTERLYGETQISRFRHGWLLLHMAVLAYLKLKAF